MSQIKVTCDKHGIDSLLGFRSYANTREAELKAACRSLQDALSASQDQSVRLWDVRAGGGAAIQSATAFRAGADSPGR